MISDIARTLRARWQAADLSAQFAVTAAAVVGCGMAVLGWWVVGRIERGVVDHAAASAALHMDIFIEPHLQELARSKQISPEQQKALNDLISVTEHGQSVVAVTVWGRDGTMIFSTEPFAAGKGPIAPSHIITSAWNGNIPSTFEPVEPTIAHTAPNKNPVLKVFTPMHATGSNKVIAVAELEASSPALATDLSRIRMQTTGVVGMLTLAMVASLFGIVRRGSRMIGEQRLSLEDRVRELTALLQENAGLQSRIVDINRRATDHNDKSLRRIGAELHDGPVQLIALSLLRLESLRLPDFNSVEGRNHDDLDAIEAALRDALKEIRQLCSGLALPDLERAPIAKVIEYAIMNHERRSRTQVSRQITKSLPATAPPLLLMCVYRFIQEALTNAVRHAGGKDQSVIAAYSAGRLRIEVADGGGGMTARDLDPARFAAGHGLGLAGLKDRVETLGGAFTISSGADSGTRLAAEFELDGLFDPVPPNSGIVLQ